MSGANFHVRPALVSIPHHLCTCSIELTSKLARDYLRLMSSMNSVIMQTNKRKLLELLVACIYVRSISRGVARVTTLGGNHKLVLLTGAEERPAGKISGFGSVKLTIRCTQNIVSTQIQAFPSSFRYQARFKFSIKVVPQMIEEAIAPPPLTTPLSIRQCCNFVSAILKAQI